MDALNNEALTGLTTALQSLIPPSADPSLAPDLTVAPTRFASTGLNGYVGIHRDPDGEIVGRRVKANAIVGVKTKTLDGLNAAVAGVTAAVVGAPRADLRRLGILDVGVAAVGSQVPAAGAKPARQEVTFGVSYEFLKLPTETSGVIGSVPLGLDLSRDHDPTTLVAGEFTQQSLLELQVVDDPLATKNTPSSWSFDTAQQRIQQTSSIWGGTAAVNANKPGTYLVVPASPSRPAVEDLILRSEVQSDGDQGIGLVFRFVDAANFCFFVANANKNYRLLGKKTGGTFQQLAVDATISFTVGTSSRLKVVAAGPALEVFVDDRSAVAGVDPSPAAGRVGLLAYRNPKAFFYGIELVAI
jgi:hypothetical protein